MSLNYQTSRVEPGIMVVHLMGTILLWPEGQIDIIDELLNHNEKKLIIDLSGIEHMDSSGAELMFECFNTVNKAGGELRYAGAKPKVARLFQITQLDKILPFFPTLEAAIGSFSVRRAGEDGG